MKTKKSSAIFRISDKVITKVAHLVRKVFPRQDNQEEMLPPGLENFGFKTIIDVGANEGQFVKKIRKIYPEAKIYSFEPLPEVFDVLRNNFANDLNFKAFNYALGDETKESLFHLNEYSPSSSLLKLENEHKKHFNFAVTETEVSVTIKRLDDIARELDLVNPVLLKIDTQGYEKPVIKGGLNVISHVDVILVEVSFKKLFEGGISFDNMYSLLTGLGYKYMGNIEQLYSPQTHEILQADALFIR